MTPRGSGSFVALNPTLGEAAAAMFLVTLTGIGLCVYLLVCAAADPVPLAATVLVDAATLCLFVVDLRLAHAIVNADAVCP